MGSAVCSAEVPARQSSPSKTSAHRPPATGPRRTPETTASKGPGSGASETASRPSSARISPSGVPSGRAAKIAGSFGSPHAGAVVPVQARTVSVKIRRRLGPCLRSGPAILSPLFPTPLRGPSVHVTVSASIDVVVLPAVGVPRRGSGLRSPGPSHVLSRPLISVLTWSVDV